MRTMSKLICIAVLGMLATAGAMNTSMAQTRYGTSATRDLISRIETRADTFRQSVQASLARGGRNTTSRGDELNRLIADFQTATSDLNRRFSPRQTTPAQVRAVLDRAALINNFLLNNQIGRAAQRDWELLRGDLDQLAQTYNLNWQWDTTGTTGNTGNTGDTGYNSYSLTDPQMRQLAMRIDTRTATFARSFRQELSRQNANNRYSRDEALRQLSEFETAAAQLRNRLNSRQSNSDDARNVLEHAAFLNTYLADNQPGYQSENSWNLLKQDLDQLASAYNVAWNWSTVPAPGGSVIGADARLTGTYQINPARSDDARHVAETATRSLPVNNRQRVLDSLIRRLDPPESLAIERRGNSITIASARAPQIDFVADGTEHVETYANGRTSRVRASFVGDQLNIVTTGDRAQDFTVTFEPADNGRRLLVTRRLYSDQFTQPVIVRTYYDKTSDVAQLNLYNGSPTISNVGTSSGDFVIPNGTQLVAVLNTNLSTQNARDNDRFTLTVRSPGQYEGATIEGYVTNVNRSGRVTGRADLTLNFDSIRLRDGGSYRFAGIVDSVRTPDGQNVRIDNEGAVREEDSQTNKTVTRTAIGTAVGAIIGAIASGGKGAAIGAVIGAGAGAGSVYVQGRNDLELNTGTEVTIRTTGPRN
jgi:YMGG-like Gly-zipper